MADHPDIIEVSATRRVEIEADRAHLHVSIHGSSLVTGQAALNKAREVAQLVADLKAFGIEEASIKLQGVHAETQSGMLGKSSSATYDLKIADVEIAKVADVLGVVTGQKNNVLRLLEWRYADDEDARDRLLQAAIERAQQKAQRVAQALSVRVLGVYELSEAWNDEPVRHSANDSMIAGGPMRARMSSEDLGLAVSHSKTLQVEVHIKLRVSGMGAA